MNPAPAAPARRLVVVGGGVFGITAALELRRRGWSVQVIEAGELPRQVAASTDVSKVVRSDYGADDLYTGLAEAALAGWDLWNASVETPLYHQDGFLLLTRSPMAPGEFEFESFQRHLQRGGAPRRLTAQTLGECFPAWAKAGYVDGYLNPRAGWAESGRTLGWLAAQAQAEGVELRVHTAFSALLEKGSRVAGVLTRSGERMQADLVLVAAGAWTPIILPHLHEVMWPTAQPVLYFKVEHPAEFQAPRFPVWAADIARTGWYGFPALTDGTLKVANHGPGRRVHPDDPRDVLPEEIQRFREFLGRHFPALAGAPLLQRRTCLYCDTFDGNYWIGHDPDRAGLVVAAGDSGHAFKFAPVLGGLIASVIERQPNAWASRFTWRHRGRLAAEGARGR